jgi:hypothetical protein
MCRTSILLINLINREVLSINVALQFRFKRRADTTETVPGDTAEEWVLFDFVGATDAAEAVFSVAYETVLTLVFRFHQEGQVGRGE